LLKVADEESKAFVNSHILDTSYRKLYPQPQNLHWSFWTVCGLH